MAYHGIAECSAGKRNGSRAWWRPMARQPAMRHLWRLHRCGDAESAPGGAAQSGLCGRVRLPDQLGFTSAQVKNPDESAVVEDIERILRALAGVRLPAQPGTSTIRTSPWRSGRLRRCARCAGCEAPARLRLRGVGRLGLASDESKQALPVSARSNIAAALVGVSTHR